MNWSKYFEMMVDWKKLPAYRAEPRIDSFIGYYLPEIAADFLQDKIIGIIPELPIRLGTVRPELQNKAYADRSYKVDFYLLSESGIHYLVEFKSDTRSRRDEQDHYLVSASQMGMKAIVYGILRISQVSSYKQKYHHLIDKMKVLGLLNESKDYIGQSNDIKILYVQPNNKEQHNNCIEFRWIAEWLGSKSTLDDFESNFILALREWSKD